MVKNMRVVHLSTGISYSSANTRIHLALQQHGIQSSVVTLGYTGDISNVEKLKCSFKFKFIRRIETYLGSFLKWIYVEKENVIFSIGLAGLDVTHVKLVQEADIVNLHWVNRFLSIKSIKKILKHKKNVIWTVHDSWPFTGGCHVRYGCSNFKKSCGYCRMLNSNVKFDLSRLILKKKVREWSKYSITFIAPSQWMKSNIENSFLFKGMQCYCIPNPIDTFKFIPRTEHEILERLKINISDNKVRILFGAVNAVDTPYKGFRYLLMSLELLKIRFPDITERIELHIFGSDHCSNQEIKQFSYKMWGFIEDEEQLSYLYSMADLYLFPSLDDNLPNTVMECLSCATPVVAFETGGIPELVDHKQNGYIAKYKNIEDLCDGIIWVISNNKNNCLGNDGRKKCLSQYREEIIAQRYLDVYNSVLCYSTKTSYEKSSLS